MLRLQLSPPALPVLLLAWTLCLCQISSVSVSAQCTAEEAAIMRIFDNIDIAVKSAVLAPAAAADKPKISRENAAARTIVRTKADYQIPSAQPFIEALKNWASSTGMTEEKIRCVLRSATVKSRAQALFAASRRISITAQILEHDLSGETKSAAEETVPSSAPVPDTRFAEKFRRHRRSKKALSQTKNRSPKSLTSDGWPYLRNELEDIAKASEKAKEVLIKPNELSHISQCPPAEELFEDCEGSDRTASQNPAICVREEDSSKYAHFHEGDDSIITDTMKVPFFGITLKKDGFYKMPVYPVSVLPVPVDNSPVILGFTPHIERLCGKGPSDNCARAKESRSYNKLHVYIPLYNQCLNLQWLYCAASGNIQHAGTSPRKFYVITPPKMVSPSRQGVTYTEFCTLAYMCGNQEQMFAMQEPGEFICDFKAGPTGKV